MSADRVPPMLFYVDVSSIEGETVLTLHGELDLFTQPRFMAALAGIDDHAARVVLDLSDLTFIDCSNLAIIRRVQMLAGLRGTSFALRAPNPQLFRIMELTGILPSVSAEQLDSSALPSPSRAYERAPV